MREGEDHGTSDSTKASFLDKLHAHHRMPNAVLVQHGSGTIIVATYVACLASANCNNYPVVSPGLGPNDKVEPRGETWRSDFHLSDEPTLIGSSPTDQTSSIKNWLVDEERRNFHARSYLVAVDTHRNWIGNCGVWGVHHSRVYLGRRLPGEKAWDVVYEHHISTPHVCIRLL